jgi:UDP-N-acetylmuramoyl-L-alanyl-D-glutamate--2,6-diaminopimelate ligase
LKALKSAEQNLWVVFGCGGNRDIGKRPLMGHIASQLADHVILTSDNPRFEKPEKIISDIENGIHEESKFKLSIISDRAKAIEFAYEQMKVNDVCLVAGKGAETYQIIGDKYHEFDDRKLLRKI